MEIMRNDLEITLTDDELEEAYQERLLAINRQKAREHLIDLFDDTRDEFEQSYSIPWTSLWPTTNTSMSSSIISMNAKISTPVKTSCGQKQS